MELKIIYKQKNAKKNLNKLVWKNMASNILVNQKNFKIKSSKPV